MARSVFKLRLRQTRADFDKQPAAINGASDLMVDVFGDAGRRGRSAVGTGSLPFDIAVGVLLIVEIS